MTQTTTELSLEVTQHIPFPPERVFDAWLDPKMMAKFMIPGPDMDPPSVTNDPRVGGAFQVIMKPPGVDGGLPHDGKYLVIDRPSRLQFTWVSAFTQDDSTVTLDFVANGAGTDVTLTHVRFPNDESRDNHKMGWGAILGKMQGALS